MFRSVIYRLKGINKINESDDKIVFECMKCHNRLIVHKNYGNMHLVCKCGHSCNIYTGRDTRPTPKKDPEIPKDLKIFDPKIAEFKGRPVVEGKYENQSIYFLKESFGTFSVGEAGNEVLFFPSLNIKKSNSPEIIEPFEAGEFCHYLSEREMASIKESGSKLLKLQFLEFERSQNKD